MCICIIFMHSDHPGSYSRTCHFSMKQLAPCFSERRPLSKADSKTWAVFPAMSRDVEQSQWKNRKQPGDVNSGKMGVHKGQKKTWHLCTSKGDLKASWCSKVGVTADSQHLKSSSTSLAFQQDWFMGSFRLVICNLLAFGNQSAKKRTFPGKA